MRPLLLHPPNSHTNGRAQTKPSQRGRPCQHRPPLPPMEAIRDALQEVEANCTELYHLRTKGLKEGAFAKQEEWRRAKLDFSARKLTLIDKETKKRMLEDVWQDRIELEESELQQSDAECKSKKERVKELKEANRLQRLKLREQAEQVEGSIKELRSQTTALTSQLKEVEKAQSVADRRKRAEAELVDKIGRTKARLEAADKNHLFSVSS